MFSGSSPSNVYFSSPNGSVIASMAELHELSTAPVNIVYALHDFSKNLNFIALIIDRFRTT